MIDSDVAAAPFDREDPQDPAIDRHFADASTSALPAGSKAAANSFKRWQFWVDRGGAFTDIVARKPTGELLCHKLLSDNPDHYEDATIEGIRTLLGLKPGAPVPAGEIKAVKMGTIVATNALPERSGEPTLLIITRGFGDALRLGNQNRPKSVQSPQPIAGAALRAVDRGR
ncbi:MAG TPA: hydantoinase/oxoprolinase N-terminal domain-containing protein [Geminicoccaceae bacterium]|nr:hydantoinase/oxoprolinase N-terminal domain-containing protein [Geminicoccaceae bacterium]